MKNDRFTWVVCAALFGAGTVWGLAHAKSGFFEVDNVHDFFEILSSIATVVAVVLAILGLNAWRKQLTDTADHDLARNILVTMHAYVAAIKAVRHPTIMPHEIVPDPGELVSEDPDLKVVFGEMRAYRRRIGRAEPIRTKMFSYCTEAGVVWGEAYKNKIKKLMDFEVEVTSYMWSYFSSKNPEEDPVLRHVHLAAVNSKRNALVGELSGKDEFTEDMMACFSELEEMIRLKLIR